jgi:hypothetical protein
MLFFEPSAIPTVDWVSDCLSNIEVAFMLKMPAIVGAHRVNFIGGISQENADKNLKQFELLIATILKKWPDVQFKSSIELTEML